MKKVTEQAIERILSQGVRDMPQNPASQGFSERQIRAFYYIPEQEILKLLSQVEDANEEQIKEFKSVGDWDIEKDYKTFNIVRYGNASYIAIKNVAKGILPTEEEYWKMVARDGKTYEVDKTLSIENAPADAKAVGEKFNEIFNGFATTEDIDGLFAEEYTDILEDNY